MKGRFLVIHTYNDIHYGMTNHNVTNVKEIFTDFLAFYDKEDDLLYMLPKREVRAIVVCEEVGKD